VVGTWYASICGRVSILGVGQVLNANGEIIGTYMVEELEQEYAALREKVHDLQEYL
jgi:hypothetical protein